MNNIFISYAREDRENARRLARALEAQEWNVFWDPKIPAGKTWRGVIGEKLNAADCLVVLWSKASVSSDWVIEEAEIGRRRNVLVPVFIEQDVEPPLGFRNLQAADLAKWDGSETDQVFRSLVNDITETLGPAAAKESPPPEKKEVPPEPLPKPTPWYRRKGPILIASSLVVVLAFIMFGYQLRLKSAAEESRRNLILTQAKEKLDEPKPTKSDAGIAQDPAPPAGMVSVPGGEFMMGRDRAEGGDDYEHPAHKVVVKPFFIDLYEVTSEDYKKCVDENKCQSPHGWQHGNYANGAARHPVTGVTWDQANDYARWKGKRLPTEAEWEYAARGGDGRRYPWGNEWKPELANANHASSGMVDVGTYKGASPVGAFDMVGNAWEWTASNLTAYTGGKLPEQPPAGSKVVRGGNYESNKDHGATTTYRLGLLPVGDSSKYISTGFRCVKDISSSTSEAIQH